MHVVNTIGDTLVPATAQAILDNLRYQKLLSPEAARLIGQRRIRPGLPGYSGGTAGPAAGRADETDVDNHQSANGLRRLFHALSKLR